MNKFEAYTAGKIAAWQGLEWWENPHSDIYDGDRECFQYWVAGWCYGKKNPDPTKSA